MGYISQKDKQALITLVGDCVNYGFTEKESLSYIKARFGKEISARSYYNIKKNNIDSGDHAKEWLNYFTKVGFVINHKNIIDTIEMVQKDTIRDYIIEQNNNNKNPNEIRQLRYEIRENAKLLQELSLGTPIVAQIKAKIENAQMLQSSK